MQFLNDIVLRALKKQLILHCGCLKSFCLFHCLSVFWTTLAYWPTWLIFWIPFRLFRSTGKYGYRVHYKHFSATICSVGYHYFDVDIPA